MRLACRRVRYIPRAWLPRRCQKMGSGDHDRSRRIPTPVSAIDRRSLPPTTRPRERGLRDHSTCGRDRMGMHFGYAHAARMDTNRGEGQTRSARLGQDAMTAPVGDSTHCGGQPAPSTERAVDPVRVFGSVLCAIDRSANAQAPWRHAALLASPGGVVETVSESQLFRQGKPALFHDCEDHDLLVVGAGVASYAAVLSAPIPILVARRCPLGTQVTDTILVPIDDTPQSSHAVVLAGRLAADHGGTVAILPAPPRDSSFQRAIAAGERVLLRATGAAPPVLGNQVPPERSI